MVLDGRVLLFALGLTLLAAVAFGALPALGAARRGSAEILRQGGRSASASTKATAQRLLVIGQVAIAVVLLAGAGLFANSYARLLRVELGMRSAGLVVARLSPTLGDDGTEVIRSFYAQVLPRVAALPGVERVAITYSPPMGQSNFRQTVLTETMDEDEDGIWPGNVIISPDYLEVAGVPLLRGRVFNAADTLSAPNVAIVNEQMAAELWPGEDPLGKRFKWGRSLAGSLDSFDPEFFPRDWLTVVGVAGNVRRRSLAEEPIGEYYRPHAQMSWPVMALTVSRRTHDIGIRMALGAGRASVRRQVVVEGMRLAVAGVTIGLVVALGTSRLIGAMLYDVEPTDPLTFTGVLVLTLVVAAAACYLPARRASRLDPLAALRSH